MLLVLAVLFLVPLLVLVPLLARRRHRRRSALLPDSHPAMSPAVAQARAGYADFLRAVAQPSPHTEDFCVRVRIAHNGGFEHCWFNQLEATPFGLSGVLQLGPTSYLSPEFSEPVLIPPEDVTDWGYMADGRAVGYFTTRAALASLAPAERRRELARLGWGEVELLAPFATE